MLPVLLLVTNLFTGTTRVESPIADQIVKRLDLNGPAADAVRTLLPRSRAGFYVFGLAVTLYGVLSLARRVGRIYTAIWRVAPLKLRDQWRGLVWLLLEGSALLSVAELRDLAKHSARGGVRVTLFVVAVLIWFGVELLAQRLFSRGVVAWWRLGIAAGLVAIGRLGVAIWAAVYLSVSLSRQAELYGPVGVVFSLFTSLFATVAVTLGATLLAAVLTEPASLTQSPVQPPGQSPPAS
ncbi:hypothetical protein [Hamadaea tsunoensis]|uniref:hypothetical protein n=1 Tax=Hamadaea tsunoensis TaxID=53368 RepID=UPI0003FEB4D1|nr:hypothetical protein [Hamadaea tsunoensis]